MECNICVQEEEKFVKCSFCNFECCVWCFRKQLMSSKAIIPFCMSCKKELSLDFIAQNTATDFHNKTYRDYRARLLFQQEMSLLPATQYLANARKELSVLNTQVINLKTQRNFLKSQILALNISYKTFMLTNDPQYAKTLQLLDKYSEDSRKCRHELDAVMRRIRDIKTLENSEEKIKYNINFFFRCSQKDCKGFVIKETGLKCGLCGTNFCGDCHKEKKEEHSCLEDDIASVALIKKTTKPCPKCASPIFKIAGCSQMFCTKEDCLTAFDWKTGEIVTKRIHNPHYYEWLRKNKNDVPANDVTQDRELALQLGGEIQQQRRMLENIQMRQNRCEAKTREEYDTKLKKFVNRTDIDKIFSRNDRIALQMEMETLSFQATGKYRNERVCDNTDLRIRYLLKEIDDNDMLKLVRMREKKREKNATISLLIEMYTSSLRDTLVKMTSMNNEEMTSAVKEIKALRTYVREQNEKIIERFGGVSFKLGDILE